MKDDTLSTLGKIAASLPPEKQHEVLDFAEFVLSKCQREVTNGSSNNKTLAQHQREAIQQIAGQSLGPGFDGRDHDQVLYEKE